MKKWMKLVMVIAVFSVILVTGCKDDTTDPDVSAFETLVNYMDNSGMTLTDLTASWIIGADSTLQATLDDYYIMDIRTGDANENSIVDYDDGHIPGAVLSSLGTIVEDAAAADNPIIVVCYTGQAAGHAVMALRLSGYSDAKVLMWGMSGWHSDFDYWTPNTAQLNHANWVAPTGDIAETESFDYPEIDTDLEDGAEILAERVAALLSGGFMGVASIDVLDTPTDYFINNYWTLTDVETYGNITGAYRINPLVLENLDPDETVVTYCWTGQTSSMITAYLTVLGYDAKSLNFGANSMIYDDLQVHKWIASADYDYDVSP